MAQYKIKALANTVSGWTSPIFGYHYWVTGTPAAVTSVPLGIIPVTKAVCIGVGVSLTTLSSGTITVTFKKQAVADQTLTAFCSTDPAIISTATAPASTLTLANPITDTVTTTHTGTTGVTDAVLSTTLASRQVVIGDVVLITTAGTFTSAAGLAASVYFRDESGTV